MWNGNPYVLAWKRLKSSILKIFTNHHFGPSLLQGESPIKLQLEVMEWAKMVVILAYKYNQVNRAKVEASGEPRREKREKKRVSWTAEAVATTLLWEKIVKQIS